MPIETLVIATRNPGKIAELRSMLAGVVPRVMGLDDAGAGNLEPEETGRTFLANATTKALAYARATGHACLADDSGLVVDALDGAPGVVSSLYAFESEDNARAFPREERDARNSAKLLDALAGVPFDERSGRFVCTMVLASASGEVLHTTEGAFEGRIGLPSQNIWNDRAHTVPRGEGGFGYDPLFLVAPDFARTSAELGKAEKNALSHRGHAVSAMLAALRG